MLTNDEIIDRFPPPKWSLEMGSWPWKKEQL